MHKSHCLELLAATLAVKSFLKNQVNKHVLLLIDSQTAVAYINNLGGTASPQATVLARGLWMWCLEKGILHVLSAQYLVGEENIREDAESREMRDCSAWRLKTLIFQKILGHFPDHSINLFPTHFTYKLWRFFTWRPDPLSEATDTFTLLGIL